VPERGDAGEDHQPEHETHTDRAEASGPFGVGDDRAAACEHEGEGTEGLGARPAGEGRAAVHSI
jgi:hypothetical protein